MSMCFLGNNLFAQGSESLRRVGMFANPRPSVFDGFGMALDVQKDMVLIGAALHSLVPLVMTCLGSPFNLWKTRC
jgi:hypothetical protein